MTTNSNPSQIIKIDKHTNKVALPTILLQNRNFNTIGKLSYTNFNASLVANGIDEVSFEIHKYVDGKECPIWDSIQDLKIIHVEDYGKFEISVSYTDNTETTKSVHGQSLEVELGQIGLYEFHINDEDDLAMNDYIPTVFWNENDPTHSLLHRVLMDKAPHWSWGYVTPKIAMDEESVPEDSSTFQRTYTADGDTIYDFLTGTVAEESNVIFVFDTFHREINCYSLCKCIDETGKVVCDGIGEDTNVLVSKNKLANEISISSDKDSVKNCFKIEGGDDVISDLVRAVNMTGSDYIYVFSEFQLNDMSKELRKKLIDYQDKISDPSLQDEYYGENGIFTRLCKAYEDLSYYESSMMPNVELRDTDAEEQYRLVKQKLINNHVGINSFSSYTSTSFPGITGNVEEMANVYVDARYKVTVEAVSYTHTANTSTGKWTGKIKVIHVGDETNCYPKIDEQNVAFSIIIEDNTTDLLYTRQKIEIALSDGDMLDIDFDVAEMDEDDMRDYFSQYSLNRLKSFAEGYNSCLSTLMKVGETTTSETQSTLYNKYAMRYRVITNPDATGSNLGVLEIRQSQVDDINDTIGDLIDLQESFQKDNELNLETFLGEDYLEFCKYRREDTYSNSNYISDGKSTAECLQIAKELIDVATKEAKKACMLQRTVSTSLNNLFALPEFEPLYDKFALFNYIRVRTDDELLKLRLIGIEFNGDSIEEINVTFSDQIESIDGSLSDAQSIYQQMSFIATSFPSTARQAKQGESAKNEIMDMYNNGLNAAKTMLSNNDNNEVTITNSGLIAKRMDDAGCYGNKQLRITGNGMYMTEDAWQTVSMAVGEVEFNGEQKYGVIAEVICGNLIAGSKMAIGNEKGTVEITGNGIIIYDNSINKNKMFYADNDGNLNLTGIIHATGGEFDGKIIAKSGNIGGWDINDNSIIKSKENGSFMQLDSSGMSLITYNSTNGQKTIFGDGKIRFNKKGNNIDTTHLSMYVTNWNNTTLNGFNFYSNEDNKYVCFGYDDDTATSGYSTTLVLNYGLNPDGYTEDVIIYGDTRAIGASSFIGDVRFKSRLLCGDGNEGLWYTTTNNLYSIGRFGVGGVPSTNHMLNVHGDTYINGSITSSSLTTTGDIRFKGKILCGNSEDNGLKFTTSNSLFSIGRFGVGGVPSTSYMLKVHGNTHIDGAIKTNLIELTSGSGYVPCIYLSENNQVINGIYLQNDEIDCKKRVYISCGNGGSATNYEHSALVANGRIYSGGSICPQTDENIACGLSDHRWSQVYAVKSSINTSDIKQKTNINSISEKYEKLFDLIEPVSYMFKNGDRVHIGAIAQQVKSSMDEVGLTNQELGAFCADLKINYVMDEHGEVIEEVPILDEYGNEEYTYGLRYEEFIMMNTHMIQKTRKELFSALFEIEELKQQIKELKGEN